MDTGRGTIDIVREVSHNYIETSVAPRPLVRDGRRRVDIGSRRRDDSKSVAQNYCVFLRLLSDCRGVIMWGKEFDVFTRYEVGFLPRQSYECSLLFITWLGYFRRY